MEPNQLKDFDPAHLIETCHRWGISTTPVPEQVSDVENLIFEGFLENQKVAIRLTHLQHRTPSLIAAEMNWIHFLSNNDVAVATPIYSGSNQLVEEVTVNGITWVASVFDWAEGRLAAAIKDQWTPGFISTWGRTLGQMHSLSFQCNQEQRRFQRPDGIDSMFYQELFQNLQATHPELTERTRNLLLKIKELPQDDKSFGLTHTDLHAANIIVKDDKRMTCIDFDDCAYHYFIQDVAMPIFYSLLFEEEDLETKAKQFLFSFLKGYHQAYSLDPSWFDQLPTFFDLRDLDLMLIMTYWQEPQTSDWFKKIREHHEHGNPIKNFPWKDWAHEAIDGYH